MSAYKVHTPFVFAPTLEARTAIGRDRMRDAARVAFRAVADVARDRGFSVAHTQVAFEGLTLALCSRVRVDGIIEVEAGLGDPAMPARAFAQADIRKAIEAIEMRKRLERAARRWSPRG